MSDNIYDLRKIKVIVGSKPSIPKITFYENDKDTSIIQFEILRTPLEPLTGLTYGTVTITKQSGDR